ncbi:phenylacetate--CoA ligase family protein [bacterium]|nr:phenylacetate--CoA ligase family protein [bacterium]
MVQFNLSDFNSIHRVLHWRRLLWRSQYFPRAEQDALQWSLLSTLLDHCFAEVPGYRECWRRLGLCREDFRSAADIVRFPVISKKDVRTDPQSFRSNRFASYRPKPMRTTGTTGSPLEVYWDSGSNAMELAAQWRHYSWFGYRLGTPFLDIRFHKHRPSGRWAWNWKCRGLETCIRLWDDSNAEELARELKRRGVRLWRGHPTAVYELCRLFERRGITQPKPSCIITVGHLLLDYERDFMQKWAGVTVGDSYGLTEHTALICRCPAGSYHIAPEYGLIEILREDDSTAAPGEEGRIVSTGLHNMAFPLIRYDTGDRAVASAEVCSCGRTLPVVRELAGRNDDRLIDRNGRRIASLHRMFKYSDGVRCSQIVQNEAGVIEAYVVPADGFSDRDGSRIIAEFKRELGDDMKVRLHVVQELPFPPEGKFKFAVNRMKTAGTTSLQI